MIYADAASIGAAGIAANVGIRWRPRGPREIVSNRQCLDRVVPCFKTGGGKSGGAHQEAATGKRVGLHLIHLLLSSLGMRSGVFRDFGGGKSDFRITVQNLQSYTN